MTPCRRCESPLERGDLRCAICGASVPPPSAEVDATDRGARPAEDRAVRVTFLRCSGCSAAIAYDARAALARCAFCESELALEEVDDPLEQVEAWVPFGVDVERARRALEGFWRGGGLFRARDLPERGRLEELRPIYWVGWVFDVEALISWTADSDRGARRSPWAPHAGQVALGFERVLVSASRGLSDDEVAALAAGYDLTSAVTATTPPAIPVAERESNSARGDADGELVLERFDLQRSQARARILVAIERLAREAISNGHVPGRRIRNVHAEALLRGLRTRRIALPAWIVAWRYRDEVHRAVVCGQDAQVVHGHRPTLFAQLGLGQLVGLAFAAFATLVVIATVVLLLTR